MLGVHGRCTFGKGNKNVGSNRAADAPQAVLRITEEGWKWWNWDLQFHAPSRRMLKWGCRTSSKEALKKPATPLSSDPTHSTSSGDGASFLSETRAHFPWQMSACSRSSSFYPHPIYELWMGRGMESKPYSKMLLKTGGVLLLLMPL